MSNMSKSDRVIRIVLWSIIGFIGLLLFAIIYLPSFTRAVFGFSVHGGLTGIDAKLEPGDLLIVTSGDFESLETNDMILFDLKGYPEVDGLKAYVIMTKLPGEETKYRVRSSDNAVSYQWEITEDMYQGNVTSTVPFLGYVIGFLSSAWGIAFILVNATVITTIVIIYKKPSKQD